MKKTLLLLAISLVSLRSISQTSNWTTLTSGTTTNFIGVSASSSDVCYVSGVSGTLLKTIDGGNTWVAQTSGTNENLYSINFIDDNLGFAVGDNGTALKTTNGGVTWSQMPVGTSNHFRCVYFLNSNTGFITGGTPGTGIILKTTDGGITWTSIIPPTNALYGIYFASATDGYTCDFNGVVVKTTNGGTSWTSASNGFQEFFSDIEFINTTTGFLVGRNGKIRHTVNSGGTWTDINSGTTDALASIEFVDSNNGFIAGGNIDANTGAILSTSNGGASWDTFIPGTPLLYKISFPDSNTGYVVGKGGTILKWTNTQPLLPLTFTDSFTNASCNNNDGSAGITVYGGTAPYSTLWSNGSTAQTISGIGAGTYSVTITDANGCTITDSIVIDNSIAPPPPAICRVTADSLSINNEIYWDKTLPEYAIADSFIVYRYDIISSGYLRIGAVSKNSLGMFTDTARNISGPNGGDPQYSSYQYKLAMRDTCGNMSALSPYHQSIFIQQSNQNFAWNEYTIEGAITVSGYQFLRDDCGTGLWHVLVNTAGLATIDPNYTSYPTGKWRVQALGLSCTPDHTIISGSNIQYANITTGIANDKNETIKIFPNPAHESVTVALSEGIEAGTIKILNMSGAIVFNEAISSKTKTAKRINISTLSKGIYSLVIETENRNIVKELVIE